VKRCFLDDEGETFAYDGAGEIVMNIGPPMVDDDDWIEGLNCASWQGMDVEGTTLISAGQSW